MRNDKMDMQYTMLGRGSYGSVYQMQTKWGNQTVAVKLPGVRPKLVASVLHACAVSTLSNPSRLTFCILCMDLDQQLCKGRPSDNVR